VGVAMLGGCDASRHAVLAGVFKGPINSTLRFKKLEIEVLVNEFVAKLPNKKELKSGIFDSLIAGWGKIRNRFEWLFVFYDF
jgi:hypothetical protein